MGKLRAAACVLALAAACSGGGGSAQPPPGQPDAATPQGDNNPPDASSPADAGAVDAGPVDAGIADAGVLDGGDIDAGIIDAGTIDAGYIDAGYTDAGSADAGAFDAGSSDAGSADDAGQASLDCGAAGTAPRAWTVKAPKNPYRSDYGDNYSAAIGDSAGGALVVDWIEAGHFENLAWFNLSPDGGQRTRIDLGSCGPMNACNYSSGAVRDGVLFVHESAVSALDGHLLYSWDGKLPPGADAGYSWEDLADTRGGRSVFSKDHYYASSTPDFVLTALAADGGTEWQRLVPGIANGLAMDDVGGTQVLVNGHHLAFGPDGGLLFDAAPTDGGSHGGPNGYLIAAAGASVYRGERGLIDARDGGPSTQLPFDPYGPAYLDQARIVVQEQTDGGPGPVASVSLDGTLQWERGGGSYYSGTYSVAGGTTLVLDGQLKLHVVLSSGVDAAVCQLPADALGPGQLLGRRLVIARGVSVDAYDLPLPQ